MSRLILVLFVLCSGILGAFGAMQVSRLFIPKSSGLAGGAEVLAYGLFGLIGGIVLALVIKNYISPSRLKILTLVLGAGGFAALFFLYIKFKTNRSPVDTPILPKQESTAPARM